MTKEKFSECIDEHRDSLYIMANAILKNRADAEDAVSNAILKGYENLEQLRSFRKFKPWMLTITKNEALKIKKKRLDLPGDEALEAMLKPTQDHYDEMWDIIEGMKEEYRLVIVLFYYNDLSLKDISKVLDIPLGTVKSRLSRGKKIIKSALEGSTESLPSILDDNPTTRSPKWKKGAIILLCLCFAGGLLLSNTEIAKADFFETFKETILDFFGIGDDEAQKMGVGSDNEKSISKPDLMMELQEKVIDDQNIYLVVKITAPSNIDFNQDISFDYFAFYKGANYNTENLLSGSRDCKRLEVLKEKSNVATYIVSLSSDEKLKKNSELTVFFKDLVANPNSEHPKMLVEGIWSVNFTVEKTVSDEVKIKGTSDMTYPFVNTTATLANLKLTPLGMTVVSDISKAPYDELGISDTTIALRLKMIDGSEKTVASHDTEEKTIVSSGSSLFSQKKGKTYMKDTYQFKKAINIVHVIGVSIEDCYVPLKEYERE